MKYVDTMMNVLRPAAERQFPSPLPSQVRLLQEFLRCELLWAEYLGIETLRHSASEFYELPGSIVPDMRYPLDYLHVVVALGFSGAEQICLEKALKWYHLKDSGVDLKSNAPPDPYEPLRYFFQRGGRFQSEHGVWLNVAGMGGINYLDFVKYLKDGRLDTPLVALESSCLDAIDAAGT